MAFLPYDMARFEGREQGGLSPAGWGDTADAPVGLPRPSPCRRREGTSAAPAYTPTLSGQTLFLRWPFGWREEGGHPVGVPDVLQGGARRSMPLHPNGGASHMRYHGPRLTTPP